MTEIEMGEVFDVIAGIDSSSLDIKDRLRIELIMAECAERLKPYAVKYAINTPGKSVYLFKTGGGSCEN